MTLHGPFESESLESMDSTLQVILDRVQAFQFRLPINVATHACPVEGVGPRSKQRC